MHSKEFYRFRVAFTIVDAVAELASSGPQVIDQELLGTRHSGADCVATVAVSLTKDYTLSVSNRDTLLEASVAATYLLGKVEALQSGTSVQIESDDYRFDCSIGSEAARVQFQLRGEPAFRFEASEAESGRGGVFVSESTSVALVDNASNVPDDSWGLVAQSKEKAQVLCKGDQPTLTELVSLIVVGVAEGVLYHTLEIEAENQIFTFVLSNQDSRLSLSVSPECFFKAQIDL